MSVQLSELIDRIKKEGLEAAEQDAARVRQQAEQQAARILEESRLQADSLISRAKAEALRFEQTGREGIRQAGRDVVLNLRKELETLFTSMLQARVSAALQGDAVKEALSALFRNWRAEGPLEHEVLVPAKTWDSLRDSLLAGLGDEIRRGLQIRPSASVQAGFRVAEKGGRAYFDFTDAALVEFLMEYLNPRLAECLREKSG
jgi:V/A-type H+/Na+-transporting ATPase subunit E